MRYDGDQHGPYLEECSHFINKKHNFTTITAFICNIYQYTCELQRPRFTLFPREEHV